MPEDMVTVLRILHHEVDHIRQIGASGRKDPEVAALTEQYDVLVTIDLYRQEEDWIAVHRAIVERGIRVLRLRLPKTAVKDSVNLHIVRQLAWRMEEWVAAFTTTDAALVTLSGADATMRTKTVAEVQEMLEKHPGYRP